MTGFMPINMQTSVATQDTSYLRQNQLGANARSAKVSALPEKIPNNEELGVMVKSALELSKQNVF